MSLRRGRIYDARELARFREFRDRRAQHKPAECSRRIDDAPPSSRLRGKCCWVEHGPPCFQTRGIQSLCSGCGGILR